MFGTSEQNGCTIARGGCVVEVELVGGIGVFNIASDARHQVQRRWSRGVDARAVCLRTFADMDLQLPGLLHMIGLGPAMQLVGTGGMI